MNLKQCFEEIFVQLYSEQYFSQTKICENNSSTHQLINGQTKYGKYM